ncbi:MAG: hypothetical protein ACT4PT_05390, partial [Methanobacteriota archaeon]
MPIDERLREKTAATERKVARIRLVAVGIGAAVYLFLLDKTGTDERLAVATILLAAAYGAWFFFVQPYRRYESVYRFFVIPVADTLLVTLAVYATGGFASPFYLFYYATVIAVSFRYRARESLAAAALSAVAYAAVLANEGTLTADPAEVAMRIAFLFVIEALASLLSSESYVQLAGRLRMRELADESKTVSPDLELGPALDRAVASARRLLDADAAAVLLLERADGTPGIADSSGLSEAAAAAADDAFRAAVEAGWPDRAALPARLVPRAAAPRLRHERAHALVFHGHVRGALLVLYGRERPPDEDDEDVGRLFASRTAAVIEH